MPDLSSFITKMNIFDQFFLNTWTILVGQPTIQIKKKRKRKKKLFNAKMDISEINNQNSGSSSM